MIKLTLSYLHGQVESIWLVVLHMCRHNYELCVLCIHFSSQRVEFHGCMCTDVEYMPYISKHWCPHCSSFISYLSGLGVQVHSPECWLWVQCLESCSSLRRHFPSPPTSSCLWKLPIKYYSRLQVCQAWPTIHDGFSKLLIPHLLGNTSDISSCVCVCVCVCVHVKFWVARYR